MSKFNNWLKSKRNYRIEKYTSQDMCETNGNVVFHVIIMTIISLLIVSTIVIKLEKINKYINTTDIIQYENE